MSYDLAVPADGTGLERRLRTAVTRRVGRTAGTDRHWDLDAWTAALTVRDRWASLHLRPRYSLAEAREAAAAWLAGAEVGTWADEHGLARVDGRRPLSGAHLHVGEGHPPSATLGLDPGTRPVGTFPASDDEGYDLTVAHLAEVLGAPGPGTTAVAPGWVAWQTGTRRVDLRRMRSRTRQVRFSEGGAD